MKIQTADKNSFHLEIAGMDSLNHLPVPIHLVANGRLASLLTCSGTGYVRLNGRAVTRWKPDATADSLGYFLFLRDVESSEFWSLGAEPVGSSVDNYCFTRSTGTASISQTYLAVEARMTVCVHPDLDVELRRCEITNRGNSTRTIELTSYAELALHDPTADLVHLSFSKIFVETQRTDSGILVARRRPRRNDEETLSACHFLVADDSNVGRIEFETDRCRFIGRGNCLHSPAALQTSDPLSGNLGSVLDPIFSLRTVVVVPPESSVSVILGLGAGRNSHETESAAEQLSDFAVCQRIFENADIRAEEQLELLGVKANDLPDLLDIASRRLYGIEPSDGSSPFLVNGERSEVSSDVVSRFLDHHGINDHAGAGRGITARQAARGPGDSARKAVKHSLSSTKSAASTFKNGFGDFSSNGQEYVIKLHRKANGRLRLPPMPWNNVICNESVGFIATETGAGNTWSSNSRLNRLTPWQNDPVLDPHSEAIYLRDHDTGEFWSVAPGPTPRSDLYEITHGWGYSIYGHSVDQLAHELVLFAPTSDAVKIGRIRLTNESDRPRRLSLYSYAEWELGEGLHQSRLATTTRIDSDKNAVFATNRERGEFSCNIAFAALAGQTGPSRFTGDRTEFLGLSGNMEAPLAIATGEPLSGNAGSGLDPCAGLQTELELLPGQTVQLAFLLGEAESLSDAEKLIEKYQSPDAVDVALVEAKSFWRDLTSAIEITTPSPAIDLMINGWLPYQNISCRMWGRTSAQQSGGAYGFRDQLQDSSALMFHRPDITRQQILRNAAHQFIEGDVLHWWHPPLSKGIRTNFSDDLLWMPLFAAEYVEATGDESLWKEDVRFLTAEFVPPSEPEVYLTPEDSGQRGSLYEHCCRALDRGLTRGANGLPLMGCGDWNDGMNRVGQGGTGESVWMAFFIDYVLERMLPVIQQHGDTERLEEYTAYREQLREAIEESGWDGEWYRRAYFDDGTPLGTASGKECRIDALVQAWAVMSGAARPDRAAKAVAKADELLVDEEAGIIRLLDPPFDKMLNDPGYIKGYLPGIRENGGQYTHGVLWLIRAIAELGNGTRACQLLEMISPVSHGNSPEAVTIYKAEPYVIAADVYGQPPHVGRAGWSWYTGSAGWMFRVAVESILGLHLENGTHLRIDPSISRDWPECTIRYRPYDGTSSERRTLYEITIRNSSREGHKVKSAAFDGQAVNVDERGARVPLIRDGLSHQVVVEL